MSEIDILIYHDETGFYWRAARHSLRLIHGPFPTREFTKSDAWASMPLDAVVVFSDSLLPVWRA